MKNNKVMPENNYIDDTLIRLRRIYSKDETVAALSKKLTEQDILIGQLKSEINHLNAEINHEKKINDQLNKYKKACTDAAKIEVRKEELYHELKKSEQLHIQKNRQLKKRFKILKLKFQKISKVYRIQQKKIKSKSPI